MVCVNNNLECFTIGHSNHGAEKFVKLLKIHGPQLVVDVRSVPYSQRNPQFNREIIGKNLAKNKIAYISLGKLLGARYNNPDLFFSERQIVDFSKVRKLSTFKEGIDCVLSELKKGRKVALMCSEKNPFNCHRFVLISHELANRGVNIKHILSDGSTVLNNILEEQLILEYKLDSRQQNFFNDIKSKKDAVEKGYILRNKDISYSK